MLKIALLLCLIAVCSCAPPRRMSVRIPVGFWPGPGFTSFKAKYLTWTEMKAWLVKIRKSPNCKNICKLYSIGQSYENRPLYVMKIHKPGDSAKKKKNIWIDAGIHAREWTSHTTALYFISRFVNQYKTDLAIRKLLKKYHVYILPCINPDGYVYSWTSPSKRFWRKNRKPSSNKCFGSDINRNFDHQWNTIGTDNNPCDYQIYPGPYAESEPETKAVAKYVTTLHQKRGGVLAFFTLHAYGQKFVVPWGYTPVKPPGYDKLICLAKIAAEKIKGVYGTTYTYGDPLTILGYSNSGTSRDWAYGKLGIPYVFTVELRGPPRTSLKKLGFVLPESEIIHNGDEIWQGIMAMMEDIETKCLPTVSVWRPYRPRLQLRYPTSFPFTGPPVELGWGAIVNPAPMGRVG